MYTRQFKISDTYTSSIYKIKCSDIHIYIYMIYLSKNVKISARKRKPLKLQTSITASIVAFDDVVVFNVDDEYDRKFCSVVVVRIDSIFVLV